MPDLSQLWIFWVTFAMLVAAGLGVPIPEELPVIGAGIWAAHTPEVGPIRWLILPVCIIGIVISDVLLYGIGRFGGARIMQFRWVARLMPPEKRARIEENFAHYGLKVLLVIRWLPGIRSPMFITAGMMRVPLWRFILADTIAATMGHSLLFFLAFWFGDQFRDLVIHAEKEVDRLRPILIISAILAVTLFFMYRYLRRPVTTADPKELPLIGNKVAAGIDRLENSSFLGHPREPRSEVRGPQAGNCAPSDNHSAPAQEQLERAGPPAPDG